MNFVLPQKKVCKENSRLHFSPTHYGLLTKIGKLATLKQRQFLRSLSLWGPGCEINAGTLLTPVFMCLISQFKVYSGLGIVGKCG